MPSGVPAARCGAATTTEAGGPAARDLGPIVVWSYPRGATIDAKGGRDSFYAVDYAARTASELGANLVKVNFPQPGKQDGVPQPYRREFSSHDAIEAVVRSANRSLLLVSGGEQAGDQSMLEKARQSMDAGASRTRADSRRWYIAAVTRFSSDLAGFILGSTAHKVIHLTDRPVLIVR